MPGSSLNKYYRFGKKKKSPESEQKDRHQKVRGWGSGEGNREGYGKTKAAAVGVPSQVSHHSEPIMSNCQLSPIKEL